MLQLKRWLKILGQNAFALVALVFLILSLPLITIMAIIHYCKRWISEIDLNPQREMSPIENRFPLKK